MSSDFSIGPTGPLIQIDADGAWLVDGQVVVHPTVLEELVRRLYRLPDGSYALQAGGGALRIQVAEAPFVVRGLVVERGADRRLVAIRALLSDGTEESLVASTIHRLPEDRLACTVKGGRFEARFSRFATYQLLTEAEPTADGRARLALASGSLLL